MNATQRIEFLDALRGIAAVAVFASHLLFPISRTPNLPGWANSLATDIGFQYMNLGRFGVVLFFLLSGYVIPLSFRGARPIVDFGISRFFRLYPAYWISIIWTVGVSILLTAETFTASQIAANLTMVQKLLGQADVNGVYWSLFVELVFYGVCVLLFLVGGLTNSLHLFVLFVICTAATVLPMALDKWVGYELRVQFLSHHLSFLFLGGLIRNWTTTGGIKNTALALAASLIALGGVPFASGYVLSYPDHATPGFEMAFAASYCVALIAFAIASFTKMPSPRPLVWLGVISYSLYIMHTACIRIAEWLLPLTSVSQALGFIAVSIVLTLVVSAATRELVEKQSGSWGRAARARVDSWRFGPATSE